MLRKPAKKRINFNIGPLYIKEACQVFRRPAQRKRAKIAPILM